MWCHSQQFLIRSGPAPLYHASTLLRGWEHKFVQQVYRLYSHKRWAKANILQNFDSDCDVLVYIEYIP